MAENQSSESTPGKSDSEVLDQNIRRRILKYVAKKRLCSPEEIARALNLSSEVVSTYVEDLVHHYSLVPVGTDAQGRNLYISATNQKDRQSKPTILLGSKLPARFDAKLPLRKRPKYSVVEVTQLTGPSLRDSVGLSAEESFKIWVERTFGQEETTYFKLIADQGVVSRRFKLTPSLVANLVMPYLMAISDLQRLIDEIDHREAREVTINSIVKGSIDVSLNGASEAIEVIKNSVVPWRRRHQEQMARYDEAEKQAEIEAKRAEILSVRAGAEKEREEAKIKRAEAEKILAEAEKIRQEIHFERVRLALEVIKQIAPNMPEEMKIAYVVKLLEPLKLLTESPLTIAVEPPTDEA